MAETPKPLKADVQLAWRQAAAWRRALLTGALLCCLSTAVTAWAAPVAGQAAPAEKRPPQGKLLLFAKDPASWKMVPKGAAGVLNYREQSGDFTFAAARLAPLTGYALVRYGDFPATAGLLAEGYSDREGVLHLAGIWKQWSKKIWLVLRSDLVISGSQVAAKAWHPERYLFEEKELGLPCSCEEKP